MSGLVSNKGKSKTPVKDIKVLIVYAAFGDATVVQVTHINNDISFYLVDGGPTSSHVGGAPIVFHNLLETFLKYTSKQDGSNAFTLDGIMVTHPDGDHYEGVLRLLETFPPNKPPAPGKAKFNFVGPMLLTKMFQQTWANALANELETDGFKDQDLPNGQVIKGFEDQFTFYFPHKKFSGLVYSYSPSSVTSVPAPPTLEAVVLSKAYVDRSDSNKSTILLVIDDPNPNNSKPLVSLNGDAIAGDVLESLQKKSPVVFKVPHHGSSHNSILPQKYVPLKEQPTTKLFAVQALVELALSKNNQDPTLLAYQLTARSVDMFEKNYAETQKRTRYGTFKAAIKLNQKLVEMATEFNKQLNTILSNTGSSTNAVLTVLQGRMKQIEKNYKDPQVKITQVYVDGIDNDPLLKLPAGFSVATYDQVKADIVSKQGKSDTRIGMAVTYLFEKLEHDTLFDDNVVPLLAKQFYCQINAQAYFISSGHLHGHPHWQVISGIIQAAIEKRQKDPTYSCRILVTTGDRIRGDKLPDKTKVDWTKFVSLQYFAGETASVMLDPNQPLAPLKGVVAWKSLTQAEKDELKSNYNETKGAMALKEERGVKSGDYQIQPSAFSSWLTIVSNQGSAFDKLQLTTTKTALGVNKIGVTFEKSGKHIQEKICFKMCLTDKSSGTPVEVYGILGLNTPGSKVITYNLFVTDGSNKRSYFVAQQGVSKLSSTNDIEDATHFSFATVSKGKGIQATSFLALSTAEASSLAKYIAALGISGDPDVFSMYDGLMFLQGSESLGYFIMSSFSRILADAFLNWKMDFEQSSVDFVMGPTGPVVASAKLVALVPALSSIDLGIGHSFSLQQASIILPNTFDSQEVPSLSVEAEVLNKRVSLSSYSAQGESLPCLVVKTLEPLSIGDLFSLLKIDSYVENYEFPLISKALKDNLQITETGFTLQQGVLNSPDTYLSNIFFGIQFTNIAQYLPTSFTSLKDITAHVEIYQPTLSCVRLGCKVSFCFGIPVPGGDSKEVNLNAVLQAEPIDAATTALTSYNFSISLQAESDIISTDHDGVSLASIFEWFNLASALDAAQAIPFIHSLLRSVQLKQLVLGFNTKSKAIHNFALEVIVPKWELVPSKIVLEDFNAFMSYNSNNWDLSFQAIAVFADKYPVSIQFNLPYSSNSANFTFKSSNYDFTIAKCLEVFSLGSVQDMPILGQLLSTAVTEADVDFSTENQSFAVTNGTVSLYSESVDIGTIFHLSQVKATIGFIKQSGQYQFSFSVNGFINNKLYLDVSYDSTTSMLSGQVKLASFQTSSLSDAIQALLKSTQPVEDNAMFQDVSKSSAASMSIAMQHMANNFTVTDVTVALTNVLTLASLKIQRLEFEYHLKQDDQTATYKLVGELVDSKGFGAVIEFDLTQNTNREKIVTASLTPAKKNSLTLKSFLSMLRVTPPETPPIEGQKLPQFLDFALTKGSLVFSIGSTFEIKGFHVEVQTTNSITLLDSPVIQLKNLSLVVDYDKSKTPAVSAAVAGCFAIGPVLLQLYGRKQDDGYIFQIGAAPEHNSIKLQESIKDLTPTGLPTPAIPTNIGLPHPINTSVANLTIKLLTNIKSVDFKSVSSIHWTIDLGFQSFEVEKLGGALSYSKSVQKPKDPHFSVYIIGEFKFSPTVQMDAVLHFGSNKDSVLAVLVTNPQDIEISKVTDNTLGFSHPDNKQDQGVTFDSLLPQTTHDIQLSSVYINLNLTKKVFALVGQLQSLGYGFLVAGNFSNTENGNNKKYGYAFGISLPVGFKFSDLLSDLSIIDNILIVTKASCVVMAISNVKVADVVSKLKSVQQTMIIPKGSQAISFPFSDLKLDDATKNQELVPGLSLYAELSFHNAPEGSLLHSVIQITDKSDTVPNVILSALISKDPKQSEFKAWISKLTLLGAFQFSDILFVYKPCASNVFELHGTVAVNIGGKTYSFIGYFTCNAIQSQFSVLQDPAHPVTIGEPMGMFGISLDNAKLSLTYHYPKDGTHSSAQEISAMVNFYSSGSGSSGDPPKPAVTLKGCVIFHNYNPSVVKVILTTKTPLTIAEFVATVFKWNYNKDRYLNIGFVGGYVYFCKNDVTILGVNYKSGYHIAANTEVFGNVFTIEADIPLDKSGVTIHGFTKAPIDFGFAKFTGIDSSDKPDENKSPELSLSTSSSSTSISLDVGLVLFQEPLATAKLGFKVEKESGKRKLVFFGQLKYDGNIGFLQNPSISFEWSKVDGFRVTGWPAQGSFKDAFDFFKKLREFKDDCGSLVDLAFKEGVQTNVSFNIKLSKTTDTKTFLADIEIIGTYNIALLGQVKIASIPLPDMRVGIPREKDFNLSKLPQFILDLFADNAERIVAQVVSDPKRLAKLLAVVALKTISQQVLKVLLCRKVNKEDIDPEDDGEDVGKDDFDDAENEEAELGDMATGAEDALAGGEIGGAAGLFSGFLSFFGSVFSGLIGGLLGVFTSILSIFPGFGFYSSKKNDVEDMNGRVEKRKKALEQKMTEALDIKESPNAVFTPPNQLQVSWNALTDKSPTGPKAQYKVVVSGLALGSLSMDQSTIPIKIFDGCVKDNKLHIENDQLYNAVGLTVTVNGTVTAKEHTFNGPSYSVQVPNVHPTLHSPKDVHISYDHSTQQINANASTVKNAKAYYYELIESDNTRIGHCTSTTQCHFPHSDVPSVYKQPFKVRCQAVAEVGDGSENISSSAFTYSNSLPILNPATDLVVSLPHFTGKLPNTQTVTVTWELPSQSSNLYLCQIIANPSKKIVVFKELTKPSNAEIHKLSCEFTMEDILTSLRAKHLIPSTPNNSINLDIQVCAVSQSADTIDSVFVTSQLSSLESPSDVSFQLSEENALLQISWDYPRKDSDSGSSYPTHFGIEILNPQSSVVWAKLVLHYKDTATDSERIHYNVPLSSLAAAVNTPDTDYSLQIVAVASGDSELDSLVPAKAANFLRVLPVPKIEELCYSVEHNTVQLSVKAMSGVSKYKAILHTSNNSSVATKVIDTSSQGTVAASFAVDSFIDQLSYGDKVGGGVLSLGDSHTLSSALSQSPNTLEVAGQPLSFVYSHSPDTDSTTLVCSGVPGISTYKLGFKDPSGQVPDVYNLVTEKPITTVIPDSRLVDTHVTQWKCYAEACVESNSQLPSPHMFGPEPIDILPRPSNVSLRFLSLDQFVIRVEFSRVLKAASYHLTCSACSPGYKETVSQVTSDTHTVQAEIDLNEEVADWVYKLSHCIVKSLTVTVTAVGGNYSITGMPSSATLSQADPPSGLEYSYSAKSGIITLTCDAIHEGKYTFGIESGTTVIPILGKISNGKAYGTTDVDIIQVQHINEWHVYAQYSGGEEHLPSRVFFQQHLFILDSPSITSFGYDSTDDTLNIEWAAVAHAASYKVKLQYESTTGKFTYDSKVVEGTQTKLVPKKIDNLKHIMCTVTAIGSGWFITGVPSKSSSLTTLDQPENVQVTPTMCLVRATWNKVSYTSQYKVDFIINNKITRRAFVNKCTIAKQFLLPPSGSSSQNGFVSAKVTALPEKGTHFLPGPSAVNSSFYSVKGNVIQKSSVTPTGIYFDGVFNDGIVTNNVKGIRSLTIHHGASINSLQAEYLLADGTMLTAQKHGTDSGTETKLTFDDQEFIVQIQLKSTGISDQSRISNLTIFTEKADGSQTKHGPFGTDNDPGLATSMFRGCIIGFWGYCTESINAIGFYYSSLPQIIASELFGGKLGEAFDDEISSHCPQVVNIRELNFNYDSVIGISSIQANYLLQDGSTWQAKKHGTQRARETEILKFEPGEELIRVKATEYQDEKSQVRVGQLTFITSLDGSLKQYGPYGRSSGSPKTIVSGRILGIFGKSSDSIEAIGFNYTLQKTEQFGVFAVMSWPFDDPLTTHRPQIVGIKSLRIEYRDSYGCQGIQTTYSLADGSTWSSPTHGGTLSPKGPWVNIDLKEGEEIIRITGRAIWDFGSITHIGQLKIITNLSTYGPYPSSTPPAIQGYKDFDCSERILGFFGNSSFGLYALGMYYIP